MSYRFPWHTLTDDQLLDLRICDLPIKIKGSFLEPHIKRSTANSTNAGFASNHTFGYPKSGFLRMAFLALPSRFIWHIRG